MKIFNDILKECIKGLNNPVSEEGLLNLFSETPSIKSAIPGYFNQLRENDFLSEIKTEEATLYQYKDCLNNLDKDIESVFEIASSKDRTCELKDIEVIERLKKLDKKYFSVSKKNIELFFAIMISKSSKKYKKEVYTEVTYYTINQISFC